MHGSILSLEHLVQTLQIETFSYYRHITLCPNQFFEDNEVVITKHVLNKVFHDDILIIRNMK